jgi:hypothetical protein
MTDQRTTTEPPGTTAGSATTSKTDEAKDVAKGAVDRVSDVAGEAGEQAKVVLRDARQQTREVIDRGRQHLDEEARNRSRQAAGGLRTFADRLGGLADGDQERAGALGDYARQGRDRLEQLADRLDDGPTAVLDDVRRFARRQPVVFLAAAGALGFVVGRLVRGARDAQDGDDQSPPASALPPSTLPAPDVDRPTGMVVPTNPASADVAPEVPVVPAPGLATP